VTAGDRKATEPIRDTMACHAEASGSATDRLAEKQDVKTATSSAGHLKFLRHWRQAHPGTSNGQPAL